MASSPDDSRPECADDLLLFDSDPEPTLPLAIIVDDPVDLLLQRAGDIGFERILLIRWRQ
jgi:hypothetical protein